MNGVKLTESELSEKVFKPAWDLETFFIFLEIAHFLLKRIIKKLKVSFFFVVSLARMQIYDRFTSTSEGEYP